mmetsp:Transcript_5189/g.3889  ORF Transcript_5189/g.3889 Transcript_5189/m.3889 type:complete len:82 (-) Transcript_5189:694-939(-)
MLSKKGDEAYKDKIKHFEEVVEGDGGATYFTPEKETTRERVSYVINSGMPRGGNNFVRKYFEQISGISGGGVMPVWMGANA